MRAPPPLLSSLTSIAISGAGLSLFWWLSDFVITAGSNRAGVLLLVLIAVAAGIVSHYVQELITRDRRNPPEQLLVAGEHRLQELIDAIPAQFWSTLTDGSAEFLNRRWLEYTGLSDAQAIGQGWLAAVHPDDRDRLARHRESLLAGTGPAEIEARMRRFDGQYRWFLIRVEPVRDAGGSVTGWFGINTDIDDLKKAEQELRRAEERLRTTLDAIPALVMSSSKDGAVDFINARWVEDGFLEADVYRGAPALVHPDDLPVFMDRRQKSLPADAPYEAEVRLRRANGEYRWYLLRSVAIKDELERPSRRYATAIDIDDRKRAEEALHTRERELQVLVDTIPSLVWCVTAQGEPEYINKRLENYYGRRIDRSQSIDGSNLKWSLQVLMHPDDLEAVQARLTHSLRTGETFAMRYRNRRFDGAYRWVEARAEPLRNDDGSIAKWYGVSVDIDDEVRAQESLRATLDKLSRASQLASLAELSASIAHEINQPLAAAVMNCHALQRWLAANPPNLEEARLSSENVARNAKAASDIIGRVRALFTQQASPRTNTNINEVIGEVHQLMKDLLASERVRLNMDLDTSLPSLLVDRVQVQQVLLNLMRNGIDAMKANGDVPKTLLVRSTGNRNMILVEVRDNGEGITDPERIFEPFFTTKDQGMGMGLAICRSILEQHGGSLSAEAVEPRGSLFSFTLPVRTAHT
jgi:PAS domain S-box-containing protein